MYYFISGFPRAGTTLLSAILQQNPLIASGISSPVATCFRALEDATSLKEETSVLVSLEQRQALLKGLFTSYYSSPIVFDNSRIWASRIPLLVKLFPDTKFIICVREIGWVLDSFERLYLKNDYRTSSLYGWDNRGTVWSRTTALFNGVVGFSIAAVQEALACAESAKIFLIDYENFCKHPDQTLAELYEFCQLPQFTHQLTDITFETKEFDLIVGSPGLHTLISSVAWTPRQSILPEGLFNQFNNANFWR